MVSVGNAPETVKSAPTLNAYNALKGTVKMKQVDSVCPVVLVVWIVWKRNAFSVLMGSIQIWKENVFHARLVVPNAKQLENANSIRVD